MRKQQVAASGGNGDEPVMIPSASLATLQLHHAVSAIDLSIAATAAGSKLAEGALTGYTQWVSTWQSKPISVAWDWGMIREVIVFLAPYEIRSNIQLIAANGAPEPDVPTRLYIYEWVESFPWRKITIRYLLEQSHTSAAGFRSEP